MNIAMTEDDIKKVDELLLAIKKDKLSELFLVPVDWKSKNYINLF